MADLIRSHNPGGLVQTARVILIDDLTRGFGDQPVLRDLSLRVEPGERLDPSDVSLARLSGPIESIERSGF